MSTPQQTVDFVRHLMIGARHARGLRLRDFGKALGVSAATLSRFENGKLVDVITFLRCLEWLRKVAARRGTG